MGARQGVRRAQVAPRVALDAIIDCRRQSAQIRVLKMATTDDDKIDKIELAQQQLERVQMAWDPPDWPDLSHYGFHALENAIDAACSHFGLEGAGHSHWKRVERARQLHRDHGLDDVSDLLRDLNETRKNEAYGDVTPPPLNAEDTAESVERYVEAVAKILER